MERKIRYRQTDMLIKIKRVREIGRGRKRGPFRQQHVVNFMSFISVIILPTQLQ